MSDKQDIVPVTLKRDSQSRIPHQKTQMKSTVAFQVTKESTTYRVYPGFPIIYNEGIGISRASYISW
ncbi:hypothetical protein, partial [Halolactibacillus alkaliphilus]